MHPGDHTAGGILGLLFQNPSPAKLQIIAASIRPLLPSANTAECSKANEAELIELFFIQGSNRSSCLAVALFAILGNPTDGTYRICLPQNSLT